MDIAGDTATALSLGRPAAASFVAALREEVDRATKEKDELTKRLMGVQDECVSLRERLADAMITVSTERSPTWRKRKADEGEDFAARTTQTSKHRIGEEEETKVKITKSCVRIDPMDPNHKDGYQWRKYGQKVTRNNPSPRSYFKCSFAPSCPVKKKVQKSVEDESVLVVTYEGEHSHHIASSSSPVPRPPCAGCGADDRDGGGQIDRYFAEQVALCLSSDENFCAAMADAISKKLLHTPVFK